MTLAIDFFLLCHPSRAGSWAILLNKFPHVYQNFNYIGIYKENFIEIFSKNSYGGYNLQKEFRMQVAKQGNHCLFLAIGQVWYAKFKESSFRKCDRIY
jgi:hypothetical protein